MDEIRTPPAGGVRGGGQGRRRSIVAFLAFTSAGRARRLINRDQQCILIPFSLAAPMKNDLALRVEAGSMPARPNHSWSFLSSGADQALVKLLREDGAEELRAYSVLNRVASAHFDGLPSSSHRIEKLLSRHLGLAPPNATVRNLLIERLGKKFPSLQIVRKRHGGEGEAQIRWPGRGYSHLSLDRV